MKRWAHALAVALPAILIWGASPASGVVVIWDAALDLAANEASVLTETSNPNAVVPEWSYGWRSTANSTALTLFSAGHHTNNSGGYAGLDGFGNGGASGPYLYANTTAGNIVVNHGAGPLGTLPPTELFIDPSFSAQYTVARWTAPSAGAFVINATWRDLDPYGGDGLSAHLILDGVPLFAVDIANAGSPATVTALELNLAAGAKLDFVVGVRSDPTYDSSGLVATIAPVVVPEPASWALLLAGAAVFSGRQCRRLRDRP